jgi:mono/diheme cytochrome c family protein
VLAFPWLARPASAAEEEPSLPFLSASRLRRYGAPLVAIAFGVFAATVPFRVAAQGEAGNPAKGKPVFEKNCVPCHKSDGTGGMKLQPAGNPSRNFRDPAFWKGKTDAQLQLAIETGFPKSGMVPWKGVLKPQEIRDVIAYLRAKFQPKETKEAAASKPAAKPSGANTLQGSGGR